MKPLHLVLVVLILFLGLMICLNSKTTTDHPEEPPPQSQAANPRAQSGAPGIRADKRPAALPKLDPAKTITTPTGLMYEDVKKGAGRSPKMGDTVVVDYTGWLTDGAKFDSSVDRGKPSEFRLGEVVQGWNEGLSTMKVGGKRRLVIPPKLGYGAQGRPGAIPPNATLVFEVELLDVRIAETLHR